MTVGESGVGDKSADTSCKRDLPPSPSGLIENQVRDESNEWSPRRRHSQHKIHDLSFILHPSHEASRPEKEQNAPSAKNVLDSEEPILIGRACYALGVTQRALEQM